MSNNLTGTAFIVAEFRAEENAETTPLYTDNVVKIWLNEETRKIASESTAELHEQYRPHRSLASNLLKFYFVCTLELISE